MFKQGLLQLRYATLEDLKYVMQRMKPGAGISDPSGGTKASNMFCLEYDGEPVAVCGLRILSVYAHTGWAWCVMIRNLPIPTSVFAKISLAICESYSERVDNLVATVVKENARTNRFAEWLGFEIDKKLTSKYNLQRTDIMRYNSGENRYTSKGT